MILVEFDRKFLPLRKLGGHRSAADDCFACLTASPIILAFADCRRLLINLLKAMNLKHRSNALLPASAYGFLSSARAGLQSALRCPPGSRPSPQRTCRSRCACDERLGRRALGDWPSLTIACKMLLLRTYGAARRSGHNSTHMPAALPPICLRPALELNADGAGLGRHRCTDRAARQGDGSDD